MYSISALNSPKRREGKPFVPKEKTKTGFLFYFFASLTQSQYKSLYSYFRKLKIDPPQPEWIYISEYSNTPINDSSIVFRRITVKLNFLKQNLQKFDVLAIPLQDIFSNKKFPALVHRGYLAPFSVCLYSTVHSSPPPPVFAPPSHR